ncbi:LacI family DNA-binding transcriptional regulator [Nonomuraea diastatica]|uniref:LacI family transcriptional regulator n=1 Tax=Nonomuraea diastatica TaxID=1848329 RepID=A0A4R4W9M6_9ACTN|nr:LacI family DNA-binding transcriptional regulator [Nonomuraea diastatica]TDD13767.1 LacI family transcriptional regulator [Nonomuraea diastatica]
MSATIKDVAKLAGVSIKTVSNVLNGYPYLTPATKAKVQEAVIELDYRPNISARNLRRGRTGIIALALPSMSSPYFAELAERIVREAEKHDLTVLIDCTAGDLEREKLVVEGFRGRLIDGVILQHWSLSERYLRSRPDKTPLVLLGERPVRSADNVAIDSREAAQTAVTHLLEIGRRRIGVLGARGGRRRPGQPQAAGLRHEGYAKALDAYGIPFDPALVVSPRGAHNPEEVATSVAELLAKAPDIDAIFCLNDRVALAAIRALITRGVRVPSDIAVVGIDDIEAARLTTPSLTTIAPDKAGIARTAVEMLAEQIGGTDRPARRVTADAHLIARESTLGSALTL